MLLHSVPHGPIQMVDVDPLGPQAVISLSPGLFLKPWDLASCPRQESPELLFMH